MQHFVGSG